MKVKNLLLSVFIFCGLFSFVNLNAQNNAKQTPTYIQGPPQRTCGTDIPSQQWEELLQKKVAEYLAANPEIAESAKQGGGNSTQAVYTIPVIIHVIHGGQATGTYPNLAQGQLNSQIQVLNDDFAGVGQNIGNYPATAFTTWATNTIVSAASKDAFARIKIANTGVTFCLALQDSLGNTLTEPGIHRVNYNTLPALTGTFTSKNPANAVYNTPGKLQGFINGYIKPNTIWNVRKYMNIWVTDQNAAVGLLGYATFPPLSGLTGIPGGVGTATSDGFWSWSAAFGSSTIFPGGTYAAPYDKGRTCTHEIGHWVGLRHIWGDGTCATDYCNDTPPASSQNFGTPTYPLKSGSCAGPPSNAPNGEMFMNFMDYTDDLAMYMFTNDQRTRLQTAMMNSPYRNQLGTHGLCSVPPPTANFTIVPNPICAGQTSTITDMSTGSPGAWSYTMTGGSPSTSTLQSPTVTYTAAGVYSITLIASNGGGNSTPMVKTITVTAIPSLTLTPSPATICPGGSSTITAIGATTYTWMPGSLTGATIVVTPTINTTYTVTGANGSCTSTRTVAIIVSGNPTLNITPSSATICAGNSTTLTGSGAANYTWAPGGMTTASVVVNPTISTTYTLTGANAAGCTSTRTVQVTVNTPPTVSVVANPTTLCSGGSATITASGATTYSWNTGATTAVIVVTPTAPTNYTVTGSNGTCSNTRTISITVSASPTLNINPPSANICIGGSATFFGSGATNYTWMPGNINTSSIAVTPTITTTYTLTGSNTAGCTSTRTTQIVVNSLPTVTITSNPLTICPGSSATLTASASGPGPFAYAWSTGGTTASITSSVVGVYSATVTNVATGCAGSQSYSLNAAAGLTINVAATPTAVCAGGSVTLTATGATTYTWNTGPTTASIVVSPTTTTTYTVNGTSGSCTGSRTISISVNPNPTVTAVANPASICSGSSSTLTASGASTYSWSTGSTSITTVVTPTTPTTYTVVGTNSLGCSVTRTVSVSILSAPVISVTANPTSICAGSTSTLTANGSGPPGPFSYLWNTGATTAVITTSVGGVYTATFTNGNGCMASQSVTITAVPAVTINISATPTAVCAGGSTTLTASGASTYTWNTGPTTSSIVVTPSVLTTYTVTGSVGTCTGSRTISIAVNANPTVNVVASPTLICAGSTSTLTSSGATTYSWSTGATTSIIAVTPTTSTSYTVTGSNAAGCSNTRTVTVNTIAAPSVSVTATPSVICAGSTATLTASGASTYTWNTGPTTATITVSPTLATTYTVIGSNGTCTNTRTISLSVNPNPTVSVIATPTAICAGGSASLIASGASTYSWSTGATTSAISVTPTLTTTYTVTGSNGTCSNTRTISVTVNPTPTVSVIATPTAICAGASASLIASGATTYSWSTGATTSAISVTPTLTTTYTVTGSNATGCLNTRTISVTVNSGPSIFASTSASIICVGQSAVLTASSSATSYTWSTGSNSISINVSPTVTTSYTVSGTNAAGCVGSTIITQSVSPCTGITAISNTNQIYSAYPNPNHGEFMLTVEKLTESTFIEIYNTIGQLVSKQLVKDYTTKINLTEQADGVYYVIVVNGNKHLYKTKIIKD